MKSKPSLDDFRSGGAEGALEEQKQNRSLPFSSSPANNEKQNKTIRIRKTFNTRLADEAFAKSKAEGRKVNESELIDEALNEWFIKLDQSRN